MIKNVHERDLAVPAATAGGLLDALGGPDDALWPSPEWPPMRLDMPLRVGSGGGHGTIRYHVSAYEPGRRVEFTLDPGQGLHGRHTFTVESLGSHRCRIRHEITGRVDGVMRLGWPPAVRALHDAVLEDLLDRAERMLGVGPDRPARWSVWVRLLRQVTGPVFVRAVDVPVDGLLPGALDRVDATDAFAVDVADGLPSDPQWWADQILRDPPAPVVALMALHEVLVGLAGIARATGDEFATRQRTGEEVLLGADAGHLDFRAVVRREPGRVVLGTVVALRNRRGRLYWAVVSRVHPIVVRAMLARAAGGARAGAGPSVRRGPARAAGSRSASLHS
ncbi:MAG: DUF2867 domain-containing protein [Pseudonocardia sp.]|nr:DUF2867 domain-containing protein [Pseudonocardia sp.]